jgi:hypothetical protein
VSDSKLEKTLTDQTKDAWHRYLESLDGLRPDRFRYCRKLTGNAWDAARKRRRAARSRVDPALAAGAAGARSRAAEGDVRPDGPWCWC